MQCQIKRDFIEATTATGPLCYLNATYAAINPGFGTRHMRPSMLSILDRAPPVCLGSMANMKHASARGFARQGEMSNPTWRNLYERIAALLLHCKQLGERGTSGSLRSLRLLAKQRQSGAFSASIESRKCSRLLICRIFAYADLRFSTRTGVHFAGECSSCEFSGGCPFDLDLGS